MNQSEFINVREPAKGAGAAERARQLYRLLAMADSTVDGTALACFLGTTGQVILNRATAGDHVAFEWPANARRARLTLPYGIIESGSKRDRELLRFCAQVALGGETESENLEAFAVAWLAEAEAAEARRQEPQAPAEPPRLLGRIGGGPGEPALEFYTSDGQPVLRVVDAAGRVWLEFCNYGRGGREAVEQPPRHRDRLRPTLRVCEPLLDLPAVELGVSEPLYGGALAIVTPGHLNAVMLTGSPHGGSLTLNATDASAEGRAAEEQAVGLHADGEGGGELLIRETEVKPGAHFAEIRLGFAER